MIAEGIGATVAALFAILLPTAPASDDSLDRTTPTVADGTYVVGQVREGAQSGGRPGADADSTDYAPLEFLRADPCLPGVPAGVADSCSPLISTNFTCPAGMTPILPLWVRVYENGAWSEWRMDSGYSCPSIEDLYALIEREWAQLKPEPSQLSIQPDGGWVYATIPTIAYATDAPRLHGAVLLGADVTIRATPTTYTWHWGDGETTTTDQPGAAYPAHTISHAYGPTIDSATLSMETTWTGHFQVDGGAWQPFDTTISSTTAGPTLDVLHPRTHLVGDAS